MCSVTLAWVHCVALHVSTEPHSRHTKHCSAEVGGVLLFALFPLSCPEEPSANPADRFHPRCLPCPTAPWLDVLHQIINTCMNVWARSRPSLFTFPCHIYTIIGALKFCEWWLTGLRWCEERRSWASLEGMSSSLLHRVTIPSPGAVRAKLLL